MCDVCGRLEVVCYAPRAALYAGGCGRWALFVGGARGEAQCATLYARGTGDDAQCATLYSGSCGVWASFGGGAGGVGAAGGGALHAGLYAGGCGGVGFV